MSGLTLYTYPNNPRAYTSLVPAAILGVDVEVFKGFEFGKTNKTAEFLAFSPLGKVPALKTPEGGVFESNSIARYIARQKDGLYGSNAYEASRIDAWIDFSVNHIEYPGSAWISPIKGYIPFNKAATQQAKKDIKATLKLLDDHLTNNQWLVGNRLSIADIVVACQLYSLYTMVLDPNFRKAFRSTNRWFTTVVNQEAFVKVAGKTELAAKMAVYTPKKEEKKAEKKAADKKPAAAKKAKKEKPFANLPKTSFNLDEWKRKYSNSDTRKEALPWFWENIDKEGWSIWHCEYKYAEELTQVFMTMNLVGGFYQRMDHMHKFAFANMLCCGEEGKSMTLSGIWLLRGTDDKLPDCVTQCDDVEVYNWRKMSWDEKELFDDYAAWDGKLGGRTYLDGQTYK